MVWNSNKKCKNCNKLATRVSSGKNSQKIVRNGKNFKWYKIVRNGRTVENGRKW